MITVGSVRISYRAEGQHVTAFPTRAVSYLDDGRQVVCDSPQALVCDAERYDRAVRTGVAHRYCLPETNPDFAIAWTRAETIAKLIDEPVVTVLPRLDQLMHDVTTVMDDTERVVVSFALKG